MLDVADDLLEHAPDVSEPTNTAAACSSDSLPHACKLLVAPHRVLELGPVRLDREARAACGADRPAEQDVVGEDEVGRQLGAHGFRV